MKQCDRCGVQYFATHKHECKRRNAATRLRSSNEQDT